MKRSITLALLLVLLLSLLLPQIALAQGPQGDKLVLGGSYTMHAGESLNGNLVVLGGTVDLQQNSTLNGNILLAGGSLHVDGKVTGNILATGGSIALASNAAHAVRAEQPLHGALRVGLLEPRPLGERFDQLGLVHRVSRQAA